MSGACEQAVSTLNRTMHRDIFAGDNLLFARFVLLLVLNLAPLIIFPGYKHPPTFI